MNEHNYNAQNIEDMIEGKQQKRSGKPVIAVCLALVVFLGAVYAAFSYGRDYEHDKAYDEGYNEGYLEGRREGYDNGREVGHSEGYIDGYTSPRLAWRDEMVEDMQDDVAAQLDSIKEKYGIEP